MFKTVLPFFILLLMMALSYSLSAEQISLSAKEKDDNTKTLATVSGCKITVSDFRREMIKHGGISEERFNNMEEKMRVLDEMIRFELFASEALKAGYDKDPEIVNYLKHRMVQKYIQEELEPKLQDIEVTVNEIENYYQRHIDDYQKPALFKIAIIWIKAPHTISREERERLREKAEEALEEAKKLNSQDNSFGKIARKYSDDMDSKYKGGVIGWIKANDNENVDLPPEVLNAAFSMQEIGEISPLIEIPEDFYIIKLINKKVFQTVTMEEAKPEIQYKIYSEKKRTIYQGYYEKIKNEADITINSDLLRSLRSEEIKDDSIEHRPPSFPLDIQ